MLDKALISITSLAQLDSLHTKYLGRNGEINALFEDMTSIPSEEKKEYGIDDWNELSDPEKLKLFTDKYSEQKCFLNRNKLVKKEFNWIYKKI